MAVEFYMQLNTGGAAAPITGKIVQLAFTLDASATQSFTVDGTTVFTLFGASNNDCSFVIPCQIPIKMGQIVKSTGGAAVATIQ